MVAEDGGDTCDDSALNQATKLTESSCPRILKKGGDLVGAARAVDIEPGGLQGATAGGAVLDGGKRLEVLSVVSEEERPRLDDHVAQPLQ
ncbi:MAG: hypothetical protein ACYCV6_12650 [Steroidobacteraceae bacterium]